VADTD
jgi:serine/threonine-protein kinase SRPK3